MNQWFDELKPGDSWARLWKDYILCSCGAIRRVVGICQNCRQTLSPSERIQVRAEDGREYEIPQAYMGGEGRYEDWVYLVMLEREWKRPVGEADRYLDIAERSRPAARSVIVLIFWSYFETRIERLLRTAMRNTPEAIVGDLLKRYSSIGSRLDRLYELLFSSSYWSDLDGLGFESVSHLMRRVHEARNSFSHGHPEAITDSLIDELVTALRHEHESWIAVFNHRAVRPLNH